ncbi:MULTISPECIES: glycosyltransferase [Priestia]|uniref:glycosyltransferase n=1 Tax=Priestia TaxID=2800373 RepID=UPI00064F083D|nr:MULTISPECIES: glycosyltransferase [Priestia]AWD67019.1 glycosyltransferase [Priestia megaterium]KML27267.1 glycosyl transferase family 1 [Priestia aryabhattai]KMN98848.1 glycosyl transferase family 1 [Priestia aryabhattai]QDZ80710.1 glycosyltransferase [Priestia megaterium]
MKKNLLFVIPSLSAGGGEKSLVNLLSQIDYNSYNVDLFLLNHNGIFMDYIPKEVKVLCLPESYHLFSLPFYQSIKKLLLKGKISLLFNRIMFALINKNNKNISQKEQYGWKYISESLEKIDKKYDVAIGFLEKTSTYFCIDKVDALKKIGWIHIDYDKLGMDPKFDIRYFRKLNNIITVSEECGNILKSRFPSERNKVRIMYNIVSPKLINKMAKQVKMGVYDKKCNEIVILSIGRLHYQKGFELAIKACRKLVDKGFNIKWNIIGDGEERENLTKLIKINNLENHVILLGLKSNPYPYIKQADIYAQTSRFEGKSIAIDEAKILQKPIIVTNFSTARDQITDGVNGLIVDMNSIAISEGIEQLIKDFELKKTIISNLSKEELGTEEEINKLYEIL